MISIREFRNLAGADAIVGEGWSFLKTRAGVGLLCGHYSTEKQFKKVESFSLLAALVVVAQRRHAEWQEKKAHDS